jgi:hypothetical protein
MAKKGLNDELERGKKLIQETNEETGYLYNALISIGENIKQAIDTAVEGAEDLDNVSQNIAKTYKRDIVNSIKASARSMDKQVAFAVKIKQGVNVEKQIREKILQTEIKKEVLQDRINQLKRDGIVDLAGELKGLMKTLDLEDENLQKLLDKNTERQKGKNILELTLGPLTKMADKIDKSGTLSKLMSGNLKDTLTYSRAAQLSTASMVNFFIKAVVELDKIQTGLNRQFGFTDTTANSIQVRFQNIAKSSESNFITFRSIHKAVSAISDETGIFAGTLRKDVVEGAARTLELMGLSGTAVARLALNAQTTGQSYKDQELSMARGVLEAENMVGVTLDTKKVFEESAKLTGLIRANLGRNYQEITRTVGAAQALGLTMSDLAGISSNMLNFHSSIEAELTAELFIGKQLNLEQARLFALTGDYNGLRKEIMKNIGSEYEFLSMNVLAKQKYAAALGMSVDQMSNLVMKNQDLSKIEAEAAARGDEDMVKEMQKLTMQQEFNKLIEKVQTSFVAMANPDGGLGRIASFMGMILESATLTYGVLGLILGLKFGAIVAQLMAVAAANTVVAGTGVAAKTAVNPLVGLAAAALVGTAIGLTYAAISSTPVPELATGGIVTQRTTAVIGEAGAEAVIPLDAFNARLDMLIDATYQNRPGKQYAKHEITSVWR